MANVELTARESVGVQCVPALLFVFVRLYLYFPTLEEEEEGLKILDSVCKNMKGDEGADDDDTMYGKGN
jgi:hypothetical protein